MMTSNLSRNVAAFLLVFAWVLAACGSAPAELPPTSVAYVPASSPTFVEPTHGPPTALPATATVLPTVTMTPTVTPTPAQADAATISARDTVPVLCYHAIRDWLPSDTPNDRVYIVPPARFAAEIEQLARQNYHTISPDQLYAHLTTNAPLPDKPVLLTFDDSDATQWTHAVPLLQKYHLTATFFIMTVVLDKPGYLSRAQVKELDQQGMTIGAHTWDHHRVTRYTDADWDVQITRPTHELEEIVGHPIRYFAYPYGLWDTTSISHLKAAGFVAAFQLQGKLDPTDSLYTLPRAVISGLWSEQHFSERLQSPE
ncbi:MAG TPA: polysaccharide deacetylase family protein [Roseiflexaceae bacterium]|nr:polysaccharide deacetylase family protein [Roseiflexaceae bacterium]